MAYSFTSSGATPFKSNVSSGIGQMMKPQSSFTPTTPKVSTSQMLGNVYDKIKSAVSNYQVPKIPQAQVAPTVQPFSGYTSNIGTNTKQSLSSGVGQMMNKPTASSIPAPKAQPAKVQTGMIPSTSNLNGGSSPAYNAQGQPNYATTPPKTTTPTTPKTPTAPTANVTPPAQPQVQYQPQIQYQPQAQQYQANTYTPPTYTAENTSLNAQAIADMANRSRQPSEDFTKQREYANQIAAEQESLAKDFAEKNKNIQGTAGFLTQQTGLQGQLQSQFNQGQQALSSKYAAAAGLLPSLTSQQQTQQSALGNAISSSMPGMQFGQMTSQQTGRPISGGTYMDNPMLNASVNKAIEIAMQSGPSSPQAQALINGLDAPGRLAFAQGMQQATGGNYNPGMMDTMARNNEAIAKSFADTGTTINAAKQNITGLGKQATDLIQQAGLNTRDANWANEKINTYVTAQSNPVAYRSLRALNNEAQKFLSTIAGSGSNLIPTQVTANIQNLDITDMSALKLNEFLSNIQAIGTAQAETAISQAGGASGTGATGFYTGGNQGYNTTLNPGSTNYSSALSQGLVSGGIGLGAAAGGTAVASKIAPGAGTFLERVLGGIFR